MFSAEGLDHFWLNFASGRMKLWERLMRETFSYIAPIWSQVRRPQVNKQICTRRPSRHRHTLLTASFSVAALFSPRSSHHHLLLACLRNVKDNWVIVVGVADGNSFNPLNVLFVRGSQLGLESKSRGGSGPRTKLNSETSRAERTRLAPTLKTGRDS